MNTASKIGPRPMRIVESSLPSDIALQVQEFSPSEVAAQVVGTVPQRMRTIITKRFGLDGREKMTLEEIGRKQGITRERVRQIESEALELIREKAGEELRNIEHCVDCVLEHHGNVLAEEHLFDLFLDNDDAMDRQALIFLMTILPSTIKKAQSKDFYALWAKNKDAIQQKKDVIAEVVNRLKKSKTPLTEESFLEMLRTVEAGPDNISDQTLHAYVLTSKNITKNPYEEWGLAKWAEIMPRGVKDKAYLVTKKHAEPLHFTAIADRINETKFDHKVAYPQTVHNELIKDDRFVLVGRGIYALKEWGYSPGTVLDVLREILSSNGGVMSREEIMKEMNGRRKVRRNTIILNLQNSDFFEKIDSKHYKIKK